MTPPPRRRWAVCLWLLLALLGLALVVLFRNPARRAKEPALAPGSAGPEMPGHVTITFLGHAAFTIASPGGFTLLTDPYPAELGLPVPRVVPQVVTASHPHWDHAAVEDYRKSAVILNGVHVDPVRRRTHLAGLDGVFYDFAIRSFLSRHDPPGRSDLGINAIFRIEVGGLKIVHLGDLGLPPPADVEDQIRDPDVLLVPVGGAYTIDAPGASGLIARLRPRVAIPMHHALPGLKVQLDPVEKFLAGRTDTVRLARSSVTLSRQNLPRATQVIVLRAASLETTAPIAPRAPASPHE